jgi:hypothetical protein
VRWASYDAACGKILFVREMEDSYAGYYRAQGESLVEFPQGEQDTHYVRNGEVVPRPKLTPGHEGIPGGFRLWGLPTPCQVHVNELGYTVDDGELEWTTPVSGIHQVRVSAWPYLDWERPVEVKP